MPLLQSMIKLLLIYRARKAKKLIELEALVTWQLQARGRLAVVIQHPVKRQLGVFLAAESRQHD